MNSPFGGLDKLKVVYFIGIGGIGMSALARYFQSRGVVVAGYDKAPTTLTRQLELEGMAIHYEEDVQQIPKEAGLVVYTPAVPTNHQELAYYRKNQYPVYKRSDVLGWITKSSFNICIAGTHGKTTISTMIAHLLRDSGYGCNAFLGGIAVNYDTNFWSSERNTCVIEADEYDRSFLKLSPDIAIISAMDADHLDIYGTPEAMEDAFIEFGKRVKPGGLLLTRYGLNRGAELAALRSAGGAIQHSTYSLDNTRADCYATGLRIANGSYAFDVIAGQRNIANVVLNMGGMHNVENAIAAIRVASSLDIDESRIRNAVAAFRGVKRRFEYVVKTDDQVFIDDYAHHPEELRALITSAKALFPGIKCTVVFQPHLYSRTRDLAEGFAQSLDLADAVILLPLYPAREQPIPGISSETILARMKNGSKKIMAGAELVEWISHDYLPKKNKPGLLITAGAGDIDKLVDPIKQVLNKA